jgi:hypothetical protein
VGRRSIIVVDDFYERPCAVRRYALRQPFYPPYEDETEVRAGRARATWWATRFRAAADCPVKGSPQLIRALEEATGEPMDRSHWTAPYTVDERSKPVPPPAGQLTSCLWNCTFHVKPDNGQPLGGGVHNHVTDQWNGVGPQGWAGIVYLSPDAPVHGGLHLWRNRNPENRFDWMTPAENWELIDSFGNIFNRLLLVRGDVPHSGAAGWGTRLEEGRLYQTFFFRTTPSAPRSVGLEPG